MGEFGADKPAPVGYEYNTQGVLVHVVYDEGGHAELGIKGTVIPSAKTGGDAGGNVAYDPHNLNIPQNIVESTEDGMRVIAQMTRADMAAQQGVLKQPATGVPAPASFQGSSSGQLMGGALGRLSISLSDQGGDTVKKAAKNRKQVKVSHRGGKIPDSAPEVPTASGPVAVTVAGSFGQIVQQVSAVFRDGNMVILATDHRQLAAAYELPQLATDEPMPLQIGWAGQIVPCLWAGISFTLPDRSVTFSVLFVDEESSDGQGLPG